MVTKAIKKGYQQTEIGVIPEDWNVKMLGEFANIYDGTHQTPQYVNSGIPFFSVETVTNNTFTNTKFISEKEHKILTKSFKIERGDILMTRIGSIGDCKLIDWNVNASFYVSLALLKIKKGFSVEYIHQYSKSSSFKREADIRSLQWAIPKKINLGNISEIRIAIPKNEREQSAIASVLSDTDTLIESIDKLLIKKKNLKQGAMQEILTGKRRLPGFKRDWEEIAFENVFEITKGKQLNKSELTLTGEYPDWNGGIEPSGYTYKWNTLENTITISEGGNSCGFINYCRTKLWLGGHCYALKIINSEFNKTFLYQLLKFKQNNIMSLRIGSGLPNIQKKGLNVFILKITKNSKEQQEIAEILSDMDAEIEQLEQKRDKYKEIKIGMMQELLTGRIRLK